MRSLVLVAPLLPAPLLPLARPSVATMRSVYFCALARAAATCLRTHGIERRSTSISQQQASQQEAMAYLYLPPVITALYLHCKYTVNTTPVFQIRVIPDGAIVTPNQCDD